MAQELIYAITSIHLLGYLQIQIFQYVKFVFAADCTQTQSSTVSPYTCNSVWENPTIRNCVARIQYKLQL